MLKNQTKISFDYELLKLIRMWSGEDVIADLVKEGDETITVCNPIVAVPTR